MPDDLVIDTNIFMHAADRRQNSQAACKKIVERLLTLRWYICVDDGFNLIESKNRSYIGSEYLNILQFGSIGYSIISHLSINKKIIFLKKTVPAAVSKKIRESVRDKSDHCFVRIAHNSCRKFLLSHDYDAFSKDCRKDFLKLFGIQIVDAKAGCASAIPE